MGEDLLGIGPWGHAINTISSKALDGISKVFSLLCEPILGELAQMGKDKVRIWRLKNVLNTLEKAKDKFEYVNGELDLKVNPKVALAIMENAANEDKDDLQEMWAELLLSSISLEGKDDSNVIYVNTLKQLSSIEVNILKYACQNSRRNQGVAGTLRVYSSITEGDLISLTGISDPNQQAAIFNHLFSLQLFKNLDGFSDFNLSHYFLDNGDATFGTSLYPTLLALNLYFRCTGYKGSINDFLNEQDSK